MNRKFEKGESIARIKDVVWSAKVALYSPIFDENGIRRMETRRWKIKEILN